MQIFQKGILEIALTQAEVKTALNSYIQSKMAELELKPNDYKFVSARGVISTLQSNTMIFVKFQLLPNAEAEIQP